MILLKIILICVLATVSFVNGYDVINSEIIERIDLDNTQALQDLSGLAKQTTKSNKNVDGKHSEGGDDNSVQNENTGNIDGQTHSLIYATIQNIPQLLLNKQRDDLSTQEEQPTNEHQEHNKQKIKSVTILKEVPSEKIQNKKYNDPSEDKTKDLKTKLRLTLPMMYLEQKKIQEKELMTDSLKTTEENEKSEISKRIIRDDVAVIRPYVLERDEKEEEESDNYPAIQYDDKKEYMRQKYGERKTVKTHKIGDEKKNNYPKDRVVTKENYNDKDDMETDSTVWVGYGLGYPTYSYPYDYGSSNLYNGYYAYGRPYSGWTRGYKPYYATYAGSSLYDGYSSAYNNYGTGFGPYGGYL